MRRHLVVNLIAFGVLTLALLGYGLFNLLGDPLQHPTNVSALFPDASGIEPNFGVVLDGVVVGSVTSVNLTPSGARVDMALRPGSDVPKDVVASIGLANDLGEQQVQLRPKSGHGAAGTGAGLISNGAAIPVARNGVPQQVGTVIGTASRLLHSIGAKPLNSLLATLDQSLSGQADNLKEITAASGEFSAEFLAYQKQFEALLGNSAPVMKTLAANGATLRSDLASTEVLANVLDTHRRALVDLLANGASASSVADRLLEATEPNLACLLHDSAAASANVASPTNLSNLSVGLATNQWFFGAVNSASPSGPARSLFAGDPATASQVWLRTRLFIPPGNPPADEYAKATALNPVLPGAACETEFGSGVGAAHQSQPLIPVAGTKIDRPSAAAAVVRGGGDQSSSGSAGSAAGSGGHDTAASSAHTGPTSLTAFAQRRPGSHAGGWLLVPLAVLLILTLCLPVRRRRSVRAVARVRADGGRRPVRTADSSRPACNSAGPDRKETQ